MTPQEPREIAFEDIKKGDDIEARYTRNGTVITRRGVVHSTNPRPRAEHWYAEAGGLVANNCGDWKHYLHPRPVPAEPTRLGAVVRARPLGTLTDATDLYVRFAKSGDKGCTWIRVGEGGGFRWADLDPDSIDVLPEGIEVES